MTRIAIAWSGLPCYGARLIRAGVERSDEPVTVLGTPPDVPAQGMDEIVGQSVKWVQSNDEATWRSLGLPVPRIFFFTGWSEPVFMRLAREVREAGGTNIGMIDNSFRGTWKQAIGAIYFRYRLRTLYDYFWVPGQSGVQLALRLGMPRDRIAIGQYSADTVLFQESPEMIARPRRFLFVGQFIERKNVRLLCEAFLQAFGDTKNPPELLLVGSGPLRGQLPSHPSIRIESFAPPERIREWMTASRWFVLPSKHDHWPLVIHEAVLSGCMLLLSSAIGSISEFATAANSRVVPTDDCRALAAALRDLASLPDEALEAGRLESLSLAKKRSVAQWAETFVEFSRGRGVAESARVG
jgi:glycosyltransferase involved in cell wall biosynthesis